MKYANEGVCCFVRLSAVEAHAMTSSQRPFDYAQGDINALLNVPEILVPFQRQQHVVHQLYYILHVLLGNHFHGGMHVF